MSILMDIAPLSPMELMWYEYRSYIIIGAVLLAIISGIAIINIIRKNRK
ncbi:MAG: hypothetical protein IKU42_02045 [Oscillospiraceae bacterium]|nr:hypothetical protein [Oscillospiraceae bacterium]